jgi:hypothetical protein
MKWTIIFNWTWMLGCVYFFISMYLFFNRSSWKKWEAAAGLNLEGLSAGCVSFQMEFTLCNGRCILPSQHWRYWWWVISKWQGKNLQCPMKATLARTSSFCPVCIGLKLGILKWKFWKGCKIDSFLCVKTYWTSSEQIDLDLTKSDMSCRSGCVSYTILARTEIWSNVVHAQNTISEVW